MIPDDVNEVFDAIIDGKHTEAEIVLAASAFQRNGSDGVLAGTRWSGQGSTYQITAPLVIPVGKRITRVILSYNRAGAGSVSWLLGWQSLGYGPDGVDASPVFEYVDDSSPVPASTATTHEETLSHVTVAGRAYYINVVADNLCDAAGGSIVGASVFFDKL